VNLPYDVKNGVQTLLNKISYYSELQDLSDAIILNISDTYSRLVYTDEYDNWYSIRSLQKDAKIIK